MTQMAKGQPKIPQFLSTHPENQDRQERLRSHIDEVCPPICVSDYRPLQKAWKLDVEVCTEILAKNSVMECGRSERQYTFL